MAGLKRWLIVGHLCVGLALCLLFATWFVSGIAMVYYRTPVLDDGQRLAFAAPLETARGASVPAAVAALATAWPRVDAVRMGQFQGRPVYRWRTPADGWRAAWADSGEPARFGAAELTPEARRWFGNVTSARYLGAFEGDSQWSYFSALRAHYPLHGFASSDATGSDEVFFSSRTGEPVVATTWSSRFLYYLGPGLHYFSLYPIRNNDPLWRALVNWTSGFGAGTCLLGIVVGLWQLRWQAIGTDHRVIPYAKRWMRWHHWTGLAFGLLAFTFVLSGLLSMNPAGIFPSTHVPDEIERKWQGDRPELRLLPELAQIARALSADAAPKELEWRRLGGEPYALAIEDAKRQRLIRRDGAAWREQAAFSAPELAAGLARSTPAPVAGIERIDAFDNFYYARKDHLQPLPVLRIALDDSEATWLHIDPATGRLLSRSDHGTRLRRWAFNGLHSFDLQFLLRRQALWLSLIWAASLAGLALSVTGIVLAWHWLRRRFERRRRRPMVSSAA